MASRPTAVWVLDDPRARASAQAIAIAERLGVPFRRIPLSWNWMARMAGLSRRGSLLGLSALPAGAAERAQPWLSAGTALTKETAGEGDGGGAPALVISAGSRSAPVALWLKARFGCALVHCAAPGLAGIPSGHLFDLLVLTDQDSALPAANVMRVLGAPHRVSPLLLRQAAAGWRERLGHLPRPMVALLVGGARESLFGGTGLPPARAHALGRHVARLAIEQGGSVLASTTGRTGVEASDALGAGLGRALHVLYRWGEPGDNPYAAYLGLADAIVVTADSAAMMSEACVSGAPVFVALPELARAREQRLIAAMITGGQIRALKDDLSPWRRLPLDEAGRVAREVARLVQLD